MGRYDGCGEAGDQGQLQQIRTVSRISRLRKIRDYYPYDPRDTGEKMTSLPYLQLYTSDYLADTAHLTTEEHGAYLLLIMNYWQRGKPLDNGGQRLAHVARLSADRWTEVEPVLSEFFQVEGDTWIHSRIERDLESVRIKSEKASQAGRASAQRTSNVRSTDVQRSYHQEEEEEDNKKTIDHFDDFWEAYPRKTAKGAARAAWVKAVKKATPEQIISAARVFGSDPNREAPFTPHGSTWLNQERWLDGPLPAKPAPVGARAVDMRPTYTPPRFSSDEVGERSPMPENVRELLSRVLP